MQESAHQPTQIRKTMRNAAIRIATPNDAIGRRAELPNPKVLSVWQRLTHSGGFQCIR
jgi:hypothetical protein